MTTLLKQLTRTARTAAIAAIVLASVQTAAAQAATINVTTTNDEFNTGTRCSLREAIWSSNNDSNSMAVGCQAGSGSDVINVPPGTYRLTRMPAAPPATNPPTPPTDSHENGDLYADLDVTAPATIVNAGALPAFIVGPTGDRVFDILASGVTMSGLTITEGTATATGDNKGGGILNEGGLTLVNSTVSDNSATYGGGISTQGASSMSLINVTISRNAAAEDGGGISVETDGSADLQSTTIGGNTADADHNGGGDGGGLFATTSGGGGTITFRNTIVAANHDSGGESFDCAVLGGAITSLGHNLIGNTVGCTYGSSNSDVTNQGAGLLDLRDNGGSTATQALQDSSPAINAAKQCPATDQRSVPRNLGGPCDIGAWELVRCGGQVVNRVGTPGVDLLQGTSGSDGFLGLGGNDTLIGGGGKDGLCGGPGKDLLKGGAGNDRLDGGAGFDTCIGGPGKNRLLHCEQKTAQK